MSVLNKIGQRLNENLSEGLRDLGLNSGFESLTNAGTGAGKYLENSTLGSDDAQKQTRRLLESSRDKEREEGLHRILALMAKNRPVSHYFPLVTNCLSSGSLTVRSLVSVYILRQAQSEPDLALMAVNMYQKDLNDSNPAIRAMALRVLTGMNLESIAGLVVISLKRSSRDGNWHVRKMVANCLYQVYQMDSAHLGSLLDILNTLLADRSALVLGSAAAAWSDMCPDRLDLLHAHYRTLCRSLLDADEWGQVSLLNVLARYGRQNFLDPNRAKSTQGELPTADADLELLLRCAEPLLQSRNPAVTMSVIRLIFNLAPSTQYSKMTRPILRLLHTGPELQQIILIDTCVIAQSYPDLLSEHLTEFYLHADDTPAVKKLKLQCMVRLAKQENVGDLLNELQTYLRDPDETTVAETIKAIAICALRLPSATDDCWRMLLELLRSPKISSVSQTVLVIGALLEQMSPNSHPGRSRTQVIAQLVGLLQNGSIASTLSRASIYHLVGQYAEEGALDSFGPDVLRIAAKGFAEEELPAKMEVVNLSAKLLTQSYHSANASHIRVLTLLFQYILTLARYDLDYAVRDRARFLKGLLSSAGIGAETGHVADVDSFNKGEEVEADTSNQEERKLFTVQQVKALLLESRGSASDSLQQSLDTNQCGSLSLAIGHQLHGSTLLPPWTQQRSDPSLRQASSDDTSRSVSPSVSNSNLNTARSFGSHAKKTSRSSSPVVLTPSGSSASIQGQQRQKAGSRNLNDFLASESEDEESEEAEETSSEEETESSEEESSEEEQKRPLNRPT